MSCSSLINELSDHTLTLSFFGEDGEPYDPSSASYEVLCMATGTTVRQATDIPSPQAVTDIELTADDNTIQDPINNKRERRRVVVTGINSAGKQHVEAFDYYVRRVTS